MEFRRKTIELTPERAKKFLENRHEGLQRKYSPDYAEQLARVIRAGKWSNALHSVDPLMVTPEGKLINAQHRCGAVIRANKSIIIDVLYDVPEEMFQFLDGCKPRSFKQFVHSKHANTVVPLARYANAIDNGAMIGSAIKGIVANNGKNGRVNAGRTELLDYIDKHEEELEYIACQSEKVYRAFKGGSKAAISYALWTIYCASDKDLGAVLRFVDEIVADIPSTVVIAKGKALGMGKLLEAAKQRTSIRADYWVSLLLAMYRLSDSRRIKITANDLKDAIPYFNMLLLKIKKEKVFA